MGLLAAGRAATGARGDANAVPHREIGVVVLPGRVRRPRGGLEEAGGAHCLLHVMAPEGMGRQDPRTRKSERTEVT